MERKPPRRVYRSTNKNADSANQVGSKGSDTRDHRAQPHPLNSPPSTQTKGAQSQRQKPSAEKYIPPFRRGKARASHSSKAHNQHHRGERDFKTNNAPLRANQQWNRRGNERTNQRANQRTNWRGNQRTNRRANQQASQTLTADIKDNIIGMFIGSGGQNITGYQNEINDELARAFRATRPKKDRSAAPPRWVRLSVCNGEGPNTSVVKIQCRGGTQAQAETALHLVENILDCLRIKVKKKEREEQEERSRKSTVEVSAVSPAKKSTPIPLKPSRLTDDIFFRIVARYAYPSSRDEETVAVVTKAIKTALASRILIERKRSEYGDNYIISDRLDSTRWTMTSISKSALSPYADKLIAVSQIFQREIMVHADNEQQEVVEWISSSLSPDTCDDLCPDSCRNPGRYRRSGDRRWGPIRLLWGDEGWSTRRPSELLIEASKVRSIGLGTGNKRWIFGQNNRVCTRQARAPH